MITIAESTQWILFVYQGGLSPAPEWLKQQVITFHTVGIQTAKTKVSGSDSPEVSLLGLQMATLPCVLLGPSPPFQTSLVSLCVPRSLLPKRTPVRVDQSMHMALLDLNHRRRQWHPTPVLLPGKSHGQRSLVGCSPQGHKESDMTE